MPCHSSQADIPFQIQDGRVCVVHLSGKSIPVDSHLGAKTESFARAIQSEPFVTCTIVLVILDTAECFFTGFLSPLFHLTTAAAAGCQAAWPGWPRVSRRSRPVRVPLAPQVGFWASGP